MSFCVSPYLMTDMSIWREFSNNPTGRRVGDCAVRAISVALDIDWERAYALLCANGFAMGDLPNADATWGATLRQHGFYRYAIPNTCPACYSAEDFAHDHPKGIYTLGFGGHVATIRDGLLFDSWNSEREVPQFYWTNRKED